jgi:hypothetical protein
MKAIKKVKVSNMIGNSGREVPNQFVIHTAEGRYFQSYETIIAFISNEGKVTLNEVYDHSTTTGKYRNMFLGDNGVNETRKKVKSGEYKIANLNS